MGLLDSALGSVVGNMMGGGQGGGQAALLQALIAMLTQGGGGASGGGLGGLVAGLQQAGLGDVVQSWIGTGANLPVSPSQLGQALPGDLLSGLASRSGLDQNDLLSQLSQMLPQVVDRATPNGQLPQGGLGDVGDLSSLLGGLMGR